MTLVEAMERNLVEHVSWLPRAAGMRVASIDEGVAVDSGLACDTFNVVAGARFGDDVDARIDELVAHFRAARRPFAWWVGPGSRPHDLGARLAARGLPAEEGEAGMARELASLPPLELPPGVVIERVRDAAALRRFAQVVAANWQPPDANVVEFYARTSPFALAADCPARYFLALSDGEPVAAGELFLAAGVAGLYSVATVERARRRGIGAAITLAALHLAREEGAHTATLQASGMGRSLYQRLGFVSCATFHEHHYLP